MSVHTSQRSDAQSTNMATAWNCRARGVGAAKLKRLNSDPNTSFRRPNSLIVRGAREREGGRGLIGSARRANHQFRSN